MIAELSEIYFLNNHNKEQTMLKLTFCNICTLSWGCCCCWYDGFMGGPDIIPPSSPVAMMARRWPQLFDCKMKKIWLIFYHTGYSWSVIKKLKSKIRMSTRGSHLTQHVILLFTCLRNLFCLSSGKCWPWSSLIIIIKD